MCAYGGGRRQSGRHIHTSLPFLAEFLFRGYRREATRTKGWILECVCKCVYVWGKRGLSMCAWKRVGGFGDILSSRSKSQFHCNYNIRLSIRNASGFSEYYQFPLGARLNLFIFPWLMVLMHQPLFTLKGCGRRLTTVPHLCPPQRIRHGARGHARTHRLIALHPQSHIHRHLCVSLTHLE